ncbi:MAG: MBL fold metallo-hydrolase [Phycisphaerae bacterium]|nr:MBL fold metallo-hydrolase [Phycisphaerae bacterium]
MSMTSEQPSEPQPVITTMPLGSWQTNCHIVHVPQGPDPHGCWLVDCGQAPKLLLDAIATRGLQPRGILLTHCHVDHIMGIDDAQARFGPLPILCHALERDFNGDPLLNLSGFAGGPEVRVSAPSAYVADGDTVDLCGSRWTVRHVPGHSPGSVAYVHGPSKQALTGDTLFAGSIGRFDFPTSDGAALKRSVLDVLMKLPDDMRISPGHGPATTIGRERQTNPYVRSPASW